MALGWCLLCALCTLGAGVRARSVNDFQNLAWNMIDNGFRSNFSHQVVDLLLRLYAPASDAVENPLCRSHSRLFTAAFKQNEPWALRMLDASSKVPSGLLMGNAVQLGNYDECLEVRSPGEVSSSGHFSGQHCMVTTGFDFVDTDGSSTTNGTGDIEEVLRDFAFALGAKWSVCIPSSCSPHDLESHLRSVLKDMVGGVSVQVPSNACRSAQPVTFTPGDWFAVSFFTVFAILVVLSTAYDLIHKNTASRSRLLIAFSVYTNGRKLLSTSQGGDELGALHAIRTFSMLWIVFGHTLDVSQDRPAVNAEALIQLTTNWQHAFLMNYRLAVEPFLLLSGLLLCYGFFKSAKRGIPFNVPLYYLHRYIRLTPAYAAMVLLTATLLAHTGDGPLWEQHPVMEKEMCTKYWWFNMLYINNYANALDMCMSQSWYLSLDMQLYLLSPLLIYPLWRWRKFGKTLVGILVVLGLVIAFLVGYIYEFANEDSTSDINELEYLPLHTRFTPWVMGVFLGYILHSTREKTVRMSSLLVAGGWVLSCLLLVSPIAINHYLMNVDHEYNRWSEAFNSSLNKPAFALAVAWIIFACNQGYGGFVNSFFSWWPFQVLSRLTYCTYLVHYAVILWIAGSVKTPVYFNDRTILMEAFNVTVTSFVFAILLSLVFEVPALTIEKILLGKDFPNEDKRTRYSVKEATYKDAIQGEELMDFVGCDIGNNKQEQVT